MRLFLFTIITILLLSGCSFLPAVGENYKKPETKMPSQWQTNTDSVNRTEPNVNYQSPEQAWWQNFRDPILNQAIAIAIANNYDFKIALSRIMESRANVKSATSELGPSVSASTSATRRNNNINPINPDQHIIFNLFTAGFDASWELDLLGGNRRARESAKALLEASTEEKNYILISLIAEVVKNYAILRDAQNQLLWQKKISQLYQEITDLNGLKKNVGLLSESEFNRIKIEMLDNQAILTEAEATAAIALYNLELLLGKRPSEIKDFFGEAEGVPIIKTTLLVEAPASLLHNRPDIRQAERQLQSATALKGYAIAQIFPKISLSGFFGFYNTRSGNLLKSSSQVFSSGATITTPVLDFGGVFAGMKIAEERKKQAFFNYESTVYKALSDVESSLINFIKSDEKLILTEQSHELYQSILNLNKQRYEQGLVSYLEQLKSEIELLKSEQKFSQAKLNFTAKTIALYKSLGGGWKVAAAANEKISKKSN